VFSNVYDDNPRLGDALAVLAAQHADVLVLAEAGRVHDADLDRVGLREQLPNEATVQRAISDVVIRSRLPMAMSPRYERRGQPDVRLQVGGEYVRLIGVHTRSAIDGGTAAKWKDEMYTLRAQLGGDDLPLVAIGDFNATRWHAPYRQLADELRDVHDVLGHAFSNSWPNDRSYPPLIRLDHALVRGRLLPVSVHDLDVPGSDHKGLVVELALAPSG
jgi:endonuclease/exonuclease/phosphatase family metal-dependent hydrolase